MKVKVYFTGGTSLECEDPYIVINSTQVTPSQLVSLSNEEDVMVFLDKIEAIVVKER